MGSKTSIITNEQLSEYAELTYLSKSEIIFILQKFLILEVKDFDNDNLITKEDILELCDRITKHDRLQQEEKNTIAELLLKEIDLQNNGNIGEFEFIHAMSKMPEFRQTFSCRV